MDPTIFHEKWTGGKYMQDMERAAHTESQAYSQDIQL